MKYDNRIQAKTTKIQMQFYAVVTHGL